MLTPMKFLTEVSGPPLTETPSSNWIFDRIEEWAKRYPDRFAFAVDHHDDVTEFGYADVLAEAAGIAAELAAKGVKRGDRVGILMENVPQWVFALLGAMRVGAVTVPLATTLPENSIHLIAQHAGCRAIFADDPNWETASHVAEALGCVALHPLHLGETYAARSAGPTGRSPKEGEQGKGSDTALLIYTSGTTGNPKGVELTLDNLK